MRLVCEWKMTLVKQTGSSLPIILKYYNPTILIKRAVFFRHHSKLPHERSTAKYLPSVSRQPAIGSALANHGVRFRALVLRDFRLCECGHPCVGRGCISG